MTTNGLESGTKKFDLPGDETAESTAQVIFSSGVSCILGTSSKTSGTFLDLSNTIPQDFARERFLVFLSLVDFRKMTVSLLISDLSGSSGGFVDLLSFKKLYEFNNLEYLKVNAHRLTLLIDLLFS